MKEDKTISLTKTQVIMIIARFVERLHVMINNSLSIDSENHKTIAGSLGMALSNQESLSEDRHFLSLCMELKDLLSKVTIGKSCLLKTH